MTDEAAWLLLCEVVERTDLSYEAKGVLASCLASFGFRHGLAVRLPSKPRGGLEELQRSGLLRFWRGADGEAYARPP